MQLVVPLRQIRRGTDMMIWVLRCVERHMPDIDGVVFIGGAPTWADPKRCDHIPTAQAKKDKFGNIGKAVVEAATNPVVGDEFVWFNDDMFPLQDQTAADLPVWARDEPFDDYLARTKAMHTQATKPRSESKTFWLGMAAQRDIMAAWGYTNPHFADLHVPIPVEKARLADVIAKVMGDYPGHVIGHWRALYGVGLPLLVREDVKGKRWYERVLAGDADWVSTEMGAWKGAVGQHIRAVYDEPSRWER